MRFDVLTLFPDSITDFMEQSIIGRAQKSNLIEINAINIRDFSENKHKKVDDYPYGGGSGMVMSAQPIFDAFNSIQKGLDYKPKLIYLSPQGKVLNQKKAESLKKEEHIVLLCGHYEGIDERVIEQLVDEEISIGDYVLTGGELAAMVLIDCVARLIPGVLKSEDSYINESHNNNLLEYPQYTRPLIFNDSEVPEVLVSGHHANVEKWRLEQSVLRTKKKRPDMYRKFKKT